MKKGTLRNWTAALVALLTLSLFVIPAFADGEAPVEEQSWFGEKIDAIKAWFTETTSTTGGWIGLILSVGIVVLLIVLAIVFRKKLKKTARESKSESKKVVWLTWSQTLKSSYVVIVVMVICAVIICGLDILLNVGLRGFLGLFSQA